MAAKRLGSALTNITGVAGQVLKVKGDETGFEFSTPATIPAYTVTNKTVDRAINADDVTLDEVADVLATLIDDLTATGAPGGVQDVYISGTYSHTGSDTGTSYTITHNLGSEPDYWACQVLDDNGKWVNMVDLFMQSSNNVYGVQAKADVDADKNKSSFIVYRHPWYDTATRTVRFICAKIGSTAAITPFQWSTSEQVWPFEKAADGSTLYCKEINFGTLPNNGTQSVAHNIVGLTYIHMVLGTTNGWVTIPLADPSTPISVWADNTNAYIRTNADWSTTSAKVRIIYIK